MRPPKNRMAITFKRTSRGRELQFTGEQQQEIDKSGLSIAHEKSNVNINSFRMDA